MKVVVLGSSHGGYEAVCELLETRDDVEISWYEKGDFISFLSCGLYLYLENQVKDVDLIRYSSEQEMTQKGVNVYKNTEIINILPSEHKIEVRNNLTGSTSYETYDKLIISPGSVPRPLNVEGKDLKNVCFMRGRNWAKTIKSKLDDNKIQNVVVVGSGYIGLEAVEVCSKAKKNVTLIDVLPNVLATHLDKEISNVIENELKEKNINLRFNEVVNKFEGNDFVKKVITNKNSYDADLVIVAIGIVPNTKWLENIVELDESGFIKINEYMQTSQKDIFAVGDATKIEFNPLGKMKLNIALASNARKQGRFAVRNLTENKHSFRGVQGTSGLELFDYKFASTGINEFIASKFKIEYDTIVTNEYYKMSFIPNEKKEKVLFKLIYNKNSKEILGAQIISKHDLTEQINTISLAIYNKNTIDEIAYNDFFFQPGFTNPWNVISKACLKALNKK